MLTLSFLLALPAVLFPQENDAVVKIFNTRQSPDFNRPWTMTPPQESAGSGVILEGGFLITNAHVVKYAKRLEVQPSGSSVRFDAEVAFISFEDDLALLKVEDPEFFSLFHGVPLATDLPVAGSEVQVVGFPGGGDEISKTAGIVSRFPFRRAGGFHGLSIQIDAPINEGNSGGPVFQGNQVVGIAFQKDKAAKSDNVGFVIPAETVSRFLDDIEDGVFDGVFSLSVTWSKCENPAMREYLKLSKDESGVILYPSTVWNPEGFNIEPMDVLLSVSGSDVDNFGRVKVKVAGLVEWEYLVGWAGLEGVIDLVVWRDGEKIELQVPMSRDNHSRAQDLKGGYPSYYIYGPVTFIELSQDFLRGQSPGVLLALLVGTRWPGLLEAKMSSHDDERVVITTYSLHTHRLAKGYNTKAFAPVLRKVDGTKVKNLRHLVALLENHGPGPAFFEFASSFADIKSPQRGGKQDMVFNHQEVLATREEILEEAGIRRHYSKDFKDLIKD